MNAAKNAARVVLPVAVIWGMLVVMVPVMSSISGAGRLPTLESVAIFAGIMLPVVIALGLIMPRIGGDNR